jgi:hypothetical protein
MSSRSLLIATIVTSTVAATNRLSGQTAEAEAKSNQKPRVEFLVASGAVLPTGVQRDAMKRGKLTAAQLSWVLRPAVAVTATAGWARSRDIATVDDPKLDVFTYDVGAEVRAPKTITGKAITFSPFAGAGAGGRSYNYRSLHVDATHNVGAYGSAGGELGIRRIRLRLEARDYVTGFKPLNGVGASRTGNDVVVMAGLRFVTR